MAPWWRGSFAPLAPACIEEFEATHQVSLPESYRRLLSEVGDHAPIPGQARGGVLPLLQAMTTTTATDFLGPLAEPFPYTSDQEVTLLWNDQDDDYEDAPPLKGLLPIADGGCDATYHLVVTGQERGRVWGFSPSGAPELTPTGLELLPWYQQRLARGMQPLIEAHAQREACEVRLALNPSDHAAALEVARDILLSDSARAAELIEKAWQAREELAECDHLMCLRAVAELDLLQDRFDRIAAMESEADSWLQCYAGIAAAREQRWQTAEALLGSAKFFPLPMRALASGYWAQALLVRGDSDAALRLLRSSQTSAANYVLLGRLYAERGDRKAALRAYREVRMAHRGPVVARHPQRPALAEKLSPPLPPVEEIDAAIAGLQDS